MSHGGRLARWIERPWVPPACLALTCVTVFSVGLDHASSFFAMQGQGPPLARSSPPVLWQAAIYAAGLMAILGTHEMGHYLVARANGVRTSLPVFIPMPFGIGTFGAVIAMKELPPSRSILLRIGAAGPLAGGVVAIAMMVLAIATCPTVPRPDPSDGMVTMELGGSIGTWILERILRVDVPAGHDLLATPLFFAAWTGFLLTSINLFPVGQLDGGHIAYALFGDRAARVARPLSLAVMALAVFGSWSYVVWGLLLRLFVAWHPPVPAPEPRLATDARILVALSAMLLAVTFMPAPVRIHY